MKTMHSKEELWEAINEGIEAGQIEGGFDPATLLGKFVRIIDAPESSTLTDDEIEIFKEGIFINGDFVGVHNPVFFPYDDVGKTGIVIGNTLDSYGPNRRTRIAIYRISSGKEVQISNFGEISLKRVDDSNTEIDVSSTNLKIKGKKLPDYPADASTKTYLLKLVNGLWTFVEDI